MDAGSIAAALNGLGAAANLAKSFLDLKSIADVQAKVIELQGVILAAQSSALTAQSEQSMMLQQIRNLEEEVARIKAWEKTKQRYELHQPGPGIYVWSLKEKGEPPEPDHWICAKCYEDGRRSIIQVKSKGSGRTNYICFECKSEFHIDNPGGGETPRVIRGQGGPNSWMGS